MSTDGARYRLLGSGVREGGAGPEGDPTPEEVAKRQRLAQDAYRVARQVSRVEFAQGAMSEAQRRLVSLWYFDGTSRGDIMAALSASRS